MKLTCSFISFILNIPYLFKIATIFFTIATLIYMLVIDSSLFEYVWRKPVSNGNYTIIITIFFIMAIIAALLVQFGFIEKIPTHN